VRYPLGAYRIPPGIGPLIPSRQTVPIVLRFYVVHPSLTDSSLRQTALALNDNRAMDIVDLLVGRPLATEEEKAERIGLQKAFQSSAWMRLVPLRTAPKLR